MSGVGVDFGCLEAVCFDIAPKSRPIDFFDCVPIWHKWRQFSSISVLSHSHIILSMLMESNKYHGKRTEYVKRQRQFQGYQCLWAVVTKQCTLWHITYKQRKKHWTWSITNTPPPPHHYTRPFKPRVNSNEFGSISISIPWLHIFGRRPYSDNARSLTIVNECAMNKRGLVVRDRVSETNGKANKREMKKQ